MQKWARGGGGMEWRGDGDASGNGKQFKNT